MNKSLIILFALIGVLNAYANDIQIANAVLYGQDITEKYVYVEFDINWKNSWRNDVNWDAAWIFVKYQRTGTGEWHHASLNSSSSSHNTGSAGSDATIKAANDTKGVFFYRSGEGKGDFGSDAVRLRWNYGNDFLKDDLKLDVMRVAVFAIEMCYVKAGSFYLGDNSSSERFRAFDSDVPVLISDETVKVRAISGDNNLVNTGISVHGLNGIDWNNDGIIDNPDYPTGYRAFYCMKYEISQEQYVDFLNTLTRAQQAARITTDIIGKTSIVNRYVMSGTQTITNHNAIRCNSEIDANLPVVFYCDYNGNGIPNEECDGQNIACNYLKFQDGLYYAAWAGLRPMTELEYEKACRGPANYVASEYAWGDNVRSQSYGRGNVGCGNENVLGGNCHFGHQSGNLAGPLRVGVFAEISAGQRKNAGATYWGIMEMSGNLWEGCISFGNIDGRSFKNLNDWQFENFAAAGQRGGDWTYNHMLAINYWTVSARQVAQNAYNARGSGNGFRCVRYEN